LDTDLVTRKGNFMTSHSQPIASEKEELFLCKKCNDELTQSSRPEIKKDCLLVHYKCPICHAKYNRKILLGSDTLSQG
jgi:hypothetical protein